MPAATPDGNSGFYGVKDLKIAVFSAESSLVGPDFLADVTEKTIRHDRRD
jgi:hypothetical protein